MCLCLELPSPLGCGNFASVYAWELAWCFRNFPICAQCDFYKAIKLILEKSALESNDTRDLKELAKADRDDKMMTACCWLKWLWELQPNPRFSPFFLPVVCLLGPGRTINSSFFGAGTLLLLLAVVGWTLWKQRVAFMHMSWPQDSTLSLERTSKLWWP